MKVMENTFDSWRLHHPVFDENWHRQNPWQFSCFRIASKCVYPCKKFLKFSHFILARPRSAEYTTGICFETAKNTKAFEWLFTGFQHSLWQTNTTENLSLKSWLWLAVVACVVRWPISNSLLIDIWLTYFTRMCNWNYWHNHRALWLS